jgi:hypothetical protein
MDGLEALNAATVACDVWESAAAFVLVTPETAVE